MEVPEPPECPVCFSLYDSDSTIPRVLSCGHSTCEVCLSLLPNPFPNTIRCPSCTQLVKLPDPLSSLPKNIDLLRLSSSLQNHPDRPTKVNAQKPPSLLSQIDQSDNLFIRNLWSREFYLKWKNWVLPSDRVLVEINSENKDGLFSLCRGKIVKSVNYGTNCHDRRVLRENGEVCLVKVGVFWDENETEEEKVGSLCNNTCKFKYSYEAKIMKVLFVMKEYDRDELGLVLNASLKRNKLGRIFGFWCNEEDNCVFIVCEGLRRGLMKSMGELEDGFLGKIEVEVEKEKTLGGFGMIGMEICEMVKDMHVEGLIAGCLGASCFTLDEFSHVYFDFGEIFVMGRRVCRMVAGNEDQEDKALQRYVFVCPEMLIELLRTEGIELGNGSLIHEVGYGSDVWSLACVLIWLLAGKQFAEEMLGYYDCLFRAVIDQEGCNFANLYTSWKEKIIGFLEAKLGSELTSLKDIISKCLDFDPGRRPVIVEVWKCIRKLIVTPQLDAFFYSETELVMGNPSYCIGLSNLCRSVVKNKKGRFSDKTCGKDAHQDEGSRVHGDVVHGLSNGHLKCIDLKAHLDSITGLAVGGGFLFSSSHDKIVNVWSLQDFSHVHSFRSHEHRVTSVVFVDEGEPLCISADIGGVICIWAARVPLDSTPRNIMLEQKDWRYSGIHSLAVSGSGCLYTGSGDKLIKDYSLMFTMTGHKSVVSCLAVSSGILYSGSWDGTVRLWSLNDHSPLGVLGEDRPANWNSVLSLAVDGNLLLVAHENGYVTIWYDDMLLKSSKVHDGAVFSISKNGKWLFTGGWDKAINMQELSGDGSQVEAILIGSVSCNSVVTALLYWQGKLFVGQADRIVKVYHSPVGQCA